MSECDWSLTGALACAGEAMEWLADNPEVAAAWALAWGTCAASVAATPATAGAAAPVAGISCSAALYGAASLTAVAVGADLSEWASARARREALERAERIGKGAIATAAKRGDISESRAADMTARLERIRENEDWWATPLESWEPPTRAWRGALIKESPSAIGQMRHRIEQVARVSPDVGLFTTVDDLKGVGALIGRFLLTVGTPKEIIPAVTAHFFGRWVGILDWLGDPSLLPRAQLNRSRSGGSPSMQMSQERLWRSGLLRNELVYKNDAGNYTSLYCAFILDAVGAGAYWEIFRVGVEPITSSAMDINPWKQSRAAAPAVFGAMDLGIRQLIETYPTLSAQALGSDEYLYDKRITKQLYKYARFYSISIPVTADERRACGGTYPLALDLYAQAKLKQAGWTIHGGTMDNFQRNVAVGYGVASHPLERDARDVHEEIDAALDSGPSGGTVLLGLAAAAALLLKGK